MTVERPIPEFTNHNRSKRRGESMKTFAVKILRARRDCMALVLLLVRLKTSVTFLSNSRSIEIAIAQLIPPVI